MNRKDTQYPGMRPPAERIKFPIALFMRLSYGLVPLPNPIAFKTILEFNPNP